MIYCPLWLMGGKQTNIATTGTAVVVSFFLLPINSKREQLNNLAALLQTPKHLSVFYSNEISFYTERTTLSLSEGRQFNVTTSSSEQHTVTSHSFSVETSGLFLCCESNKPKKGKDEATQGSGFTHCRSHGTFIPTHLSQPASQQTDM